MYTHPYNRMVFMGIWPYTIVGAGYKVYRRLLLLYLVIYCKVCEAGSQEEKMVVKCRNKNHFEPLKMGCKAQDELEPMKTNYNLLHYLHVSNFRGGSVSQEVLALFITQLNTNLGEELENLQKKICHDLKSLQT